MAPESANQTGPGDETESVGEPRPGDETTSVGESRLADAGASVEPGPPAEEPRPGRNAAPAGTVAVGGRSRRGLQALVALFGLAAVGTAVAEIAVGAALVSQGATVPADVDSNYRFFAAFWLGAGLALLWSVPRVERATTPLRLVAGLVFLGGVARLISIASVGAPSAMFLGLLVLELVLPPIMIFWQSLLARSAG